MKHATLYRKWRPRRFGEIAGQASIVRTLRRAIETDRVSHAYLFSGPRGTGKTSSAKVLSMGLNCIHGPTPEPCGECDSCRAIVNNSSMDVVEMDAASNRGIDEIRDLRDRVNLAPVGGRAKVYIIDEVHMLTPEAFNALLKTLEEPPEHVVFVLATTDKHKVPATIISRCQSFDFRRPSVETLSEKLGEIAEAEGIETEPEALTVIARSGGGSFRDAEGLLDQLSSFSEGKVTAALVRELLGSVGPESLLRTVDALAERRAADALRDLDALSNEGRDLGQFASELISHLRNLMLLPHAPEVALAEVGSDERGPLEEQSGRIPTAEAVRMIESLGDATGRVKRGGDAKLELELCFMKLARDYTEPSVESLMSRLESLEMAVGNGGFAPSRPASQTYGAEVSEARAESGSDSGGEEAAFETPGERTSGKADSSGRASETPRDSGETEPPPPKSFGEGVTSDEPKLVEGGASSASGEEDAASGSSSDDGSLSPVGEDARRDPVPKTSGSEARDVSAVPASSGGGVDLGGRWTDVMAELKRRRQALTAAVYGEARVAGFDGKVLRLIFPEGASPGEENFHVKMAQERKHLDNLTEVLEAKFGIKPRLEVASGEGEKVNAPRHSETVREESPRDEPTPPEPPPPEEPEPRPEASAEARDVRDATGGVGEARDDAPPPDAPSSDVASPDATSPAEWDEGMSRGGMGVAGDDPDASRSSSGAASPEAEVGNDDDIIRDQHEVFDMAQARFELDDETKGN